MNYYPYFMNALQYGTQYPTLTTPQMQVPQSTSPLQSLQQLPQPQGLNGKIVDSEDVVKATEVPIGGYGIFPKADLSEIYIKSWNNNGTTSVITFKPVMPEPSAAMPNNEELTNLILQKMGILENKLDMFLAQPQPQQPQVLIEPQPQQTKKMEVTTKNGF